MIRGASLDFSKEALNNLKLSKDIEDLGASFLFRRKCIDAGYCLLELYPCYYQGWEMDEWGAIGQKEGITYILETDHDKLHPELESDVKYTTEKVLRRIDE